MRQEAIPDLKRALGDSTATVRLSAAVSLVALGVQSVPGQDGKRFADALALYSARAELNSDDAAQQLAAGRLFLMTGDPARASQWLTNSIRMNPETPAQYFLAYALAQLGKYAEARTMLNKIAPADPQYASSQALLRAIAGR